MPGNRVFAVRFSRLNANPNPNHVNPSTHLVYAQLYHRNASAVRHVAPCPNLEPNPDPTTQNTQLTLTLRLNPKPTSDSSLNSRNPHPDPQTNPKPPQIPPPTTPALTILTLTPLTPNPHPNRPSTTFYLRHPSPQSGFRSLAGAPDANPDRNPDLNHAYP